MDKIHSFQFNESTLDFEECTQEEEIDETLECAPFKSVDEYFTALVRAKDYICIVCGGRVRFIPVEDTSYRCDLYKCLKCEKVYNVPVGTYPSTIKTIHLREYPENYATG
jgi:hypothetical protein